MATAKKYCIGFPAEKETINSICTQQFVHAVLKMAGFFLTFGGQTGRHDQKDH
jgi:hypothetical protein